MGGEEEITCRALVRSVRACAWLGKFDWRAACIWRAKLNLAGEAMGSRAHSKPHRQNRPHPKSPCLLSANYTPPNTHPSKSTNISPHTLSKPIDASRRDARHHQCPCYPHPLFGRCFARLIAVCGGHHRAITEIHPHALRCQPKAVLAVSLHRARKLIEYDDERDATVSAMPTLVWPSMSGASLPPSFASMQPASRLVDCCV